MNLHKRNVQVDNKDYHQQNIAFAYKHNLLLNGFPYADNIVSSSGIELTLYVPESASKEQCELALIQGKNTRDVVSYMTLSCPSEWFEEAKKIN